MTDEFFTLNFNEPTAPIVRPRLPILHPVINGLYERYGCCRSKNGLFRLVDPAAWQEPYTPWFLMMRDEGEGDVFEGPELYPFMTTAFGSAFVFANLDGEDLVGYVDITTNFNVMGGVRSIFKRTLRDPIFTQYNLHGGLYDELSPVQPPLEPDQCFGFLPPLALGGEATREGVHRVQLREHLDLLAQLTGLPMASRDQVQRHVTPPTAATDCRGSGG
ncbi:T6SS immunity protein Tdi1 domain-containing protein [Deinococcus sp. RM]|uniref:T6SS immunity protein Tdi1 domain-containing protein n=1 Tax=Deinococcus sp. RM TaxID=2316359 RepID=UPI001314E7F4|nr:T6SS immunity protein Tdi1 domain-containing protein [Deinococcus sp. RM]